LKQIGKLRCVSESNTSNNCRVTDSYPHQQQLSKQDFYPPAFAALSHRLEATHQNIALLEKNTSLLHD